MRRSPRPTRRAPPGRATAGTLLLDVREPWELEICQIPGSLAMPMGSVPARLQELDRDRETVVICHHGGRSMQVCDVPRTSGLSPT
jgi:rhodanese-related sulfurtransferase